MRSTFHKQKTKNSNKETKAGRRLALFIAFPHYHSVHATLPTCWPIPQIHSPPSTLLVTYLKYGQLYIIKLWTKITSHFWVSNTLPSVIFGCIFIVLIYKIQHQKEKPPSVHMLRHWGKSNFSVNILKDTKR